MTPKYHVTKLVQFCYGHRLLNYDGKCKHLHGHNATAEIEISAEHLDERGMVFDFSEIKDKVKSWIDSELDHVMLLNRDDPIIGALREAGERFLEVDGNPTAEFISEMIYREARALGLPVTGVTLWETPGSFARYGEAELPEKHER